MHKKCSNCPGTNYRRINRKGFFEEKILPLFGLFPWECTECRRRTFLRSDGGKQRRPKAGSAKP